MAGGQHKRKGEALSSSSQSKRAKTGSTSGSAAASRTNSPAPQSRAQSPLAVEVSAAPTGSSSGLSSPEPDHLQKSNFQLPDDAEENDDETNENDQEASVATKGLEQDQDVPDEAEPQPAAAESSDEEPLATAASTPAHEEAVGSRAVAGKHGMKGTSAKGAGLARTAISHANAHPTQSSKKPSARALESVMGGGASSSGPSKAAAAQADLAQRHADEEKAEADMLKQQQQHQAKLDSRAVQSITSGVTVDADDITGQVCCHLRTIAMYFSILTAHIPNSQSVVKERPAIAEEKAGIIEFRAATFADYNPANCIILTGLKNIFQRQLPNMPREYIARLVSTSVQSLDAI